MIDVIAMKIKVMQASCGITALSELDLLHTLEKLYMEGISDGIKLAKDVVVQTSSAEKDCACPGGQAQHLKDCVYCK